MSTEGSVDSGHVRFQCSEFNFEKMSENIGVYLKLRETKNFLTELATANHNFDHGNQYSV